MVTDEDLRDLMIDLLRGGEGYADLYWVAYLARFGRTSQFAGPDSRTRSMSREEAVAECEAYITRKRL